MMMHVLYYMIIIITTISFVLYIAVSTGMSTQTGMVLTSESGLRCKSRDREVYMYLPRTYLNPRYHRYLHMG